MGILSQANIYASCMEPNNNNNNYTAIRRIKVATTTRSVSPTTIPSILTIVDERRDLDAAFSPGEFDVICGKGTS